MGDALFIQRALCFLPPSLDPAHRLTIMNSATANRALSTGVSLMAGAR